MVIGFSQGDDDMDSAMSNSDLAFLLCGITVTLAALLVWVVQSVEQSPVMIRIQNSARRRPALIPNSIKA